MKKGSTLFLKTILLLSGLAVLGLCLFWLPSLAEHAANKNKDLPYLYYALLTFLYTSAIPFYGGLHQGLKILNLIDHNLAFSKASVEALGRIKQYGTAIAILYSFSLLLVYFLQGEIKTLLLTLGTLSLLASSIVAVLAAVLQRLLEEAITIKTENDLTV